MREFRVRLRSVRMKEGGAKVCILHTPQPDAVDGNPENWRGKLISNARAIAGVEGDFDGYLIIGFWADGARSLAYRIPSRLPREFMPSYVAEIIRTDVITEREAERTFDRRFEWIE